jgi:hypothetical protein
MAPLLIFAHGVRYLQTPQRIQAIAGQVLTETPATMKAQVRPVQKQAAKKVLATLTNNFQKSDNAHLNQNEGAVFKKSVTLIYYSSHRQVFPKIGTGREWVDKVDEVD